MTANHSARLRGRVEDSSTGHQVPLLNIELNQRDLCPPADSRRPGLFEELTDSADGAINERAVAPLRG
jgi:hypothetical protein